MPDLSMHSPPEDKVRLFRSLFRGREDVYPRRFESRRSGTSGYQPVCGNEWLQGICQKPKIKCSTCLHQRFLPVTDETVEWHLRGRDRAERDFVMGVYPMLLDETCFFLAMDFDQAEWQADVRAVMATCQRLDVPAALERSRSGNGGHIWIFFEYAVPAVLARKLGAYLLTETMDAHSELGLNSYDRFFPNQDTLPSGGFGNLIALPLQKGPRESGNSVFLDNLHTPYEDQWSFLASVSRVGREALDQHVRVAERGGRVIGCVLQDDPSEDTPWTLPPSRRPKSLTTLKGLPRTLEITLGNEIYIPKAELPPIVRNRLLRLAAFQNPEFYKAQAMRLQTFGKPRLIGCAENYPQHIGLPRGCLDDVRNFLISLKIDVSLKDERFQGRDLCTTFLGQLRPDQRNAADALAAHDTGVLSATTAFGKTVIAADMIARRGVNTLVLVHRQQLQEQWVARLANFLDLSEKDIGRIGGGRRKLTGNLDVALIQSLVRNGEVGDLVGGYGHLIVDECHHLPAVSFEQVARRAKAKYVLGLSATVVRKDGHHPIVTMQCGPVRFRADAKRYAGERPVTHTVIVRPTAFRAPEADDEDQRLRFGSLVNLLAADASRNEFIRDDVWEAVQAGRSPIVLTERTEHLTHLAEHLLPLCKHLVILKGGMGKKCLRAALTTLSEIPEGDSRIILATGKFVGEGFDDGRLDTLFLTSPISWCGTLAQYVGRLHRVHDGKTAVRVYDYADLNEPMLARMFDRRCRGYEALGYQIQLPASAVPGWPADVPLPIDPEWKRDYAASIQRLIRDGVDIPLADLFVHAARTLAPNDKGEARARSSTERFLYRRLETLPATSGKFQLNAVLPIPFDGSGNMEVDLVCPYFRIAIELDGPHHFNDPAAYRRDRRKDLMLQEQGYIVLRFLVEDVGKQLDRVLDAILRTLTSRATRLKDAQAIERSSRASPPNCSR